MAYVYDSLGYPSVAVEETLTTDGIYNSNCLINGMDGLSNWGVILEKLSIAALMAPPPLKVILENDMPTSDGVEIYDSPKINKRTITLSFLMVSKTEIEALARYNSFTQELVNGRFIIKIPRINMKFRLTYKKSTTYRAWFDGTSKLTLTVTEADPTARA